MLETTNYHVLHFHYAIRRDGCLRCIREMSRNKNVAVGVLLEMETKLKFMEYAFAVFLEFALLNQFLTFTCRLSDDNIEICLNIFAHRTRFRVV